MDAHSDLSPPRNAKRARQRALAAMVAFGLLSTGVHFTIGPVMTVISPHWVYPNLPEQALSIVTLSHRDRPEVVPAPTPTPTPPPIPLPRTKRNIALLKYQEMGLAVSLRPYVHPPARRKANIVLDRPASLRPHDSRDADVVVADAVPTPQTSPTPGGARVDTGGDTDHLSGSVVWGDDNPPRVLKRVALSVDNRAGTARVAVQIGTDGQVISVDLVQSSGDAAVDQAALDAARNSLYAPATLNGLPVHGSVTLEFSPAPTPTI